MRALTSVKSTITYALELCLCYSVINYALSKFELHGLPGVRYVEGLFVFLCCAIVLLNANSRQSSVSKLLLVFSLCCIPSLFAFDQYSLSLHNLTALFVPFLAYQIGCSISNQESIYKFKKYMVFIAAMVVILIVVANQYATNPMVLVAERDFTFTIVTLFPFLFLIQNRTVKIILQILAFVVVLISVKRSLILGMAIAIVLYYFFSIYWNKHYGFGTKIWLTLLIAIASVGVFSYMGATQEINEVIEERFVDLGSDGASGRDYIYDTMISKINISSTSQLLFGHGYNAVTMRIFGHPAHNDVLELIYDYGLIAALLWLTFVLSIGYRSIRLIIKGDVEIGGILIAIWAMWIAIFVANCIYVNTSISATFYLFFGLFDRQTINSNRYAISQSASFRRTIQ